MSERRNDKSLTFSEVGMKTRKGRFGATLDVGNDTIYCARPGLRIWRSNLAGKVIILAI